MGSFRRVLSGLDTVQAAYYLRPTRGGPFDFASLMLAKERARANKARGGVAVELGGMTFSLQAYGSKSGYPLILEHPDYTIECGEFNSPAVFVTYRSHALWRSGARALHEAFLGWANTTGLNVIRTETLSRVDFTFDYWIEAVDFTADSVVSQSSKDSQYRGDGRLQTLNFGKCDIVLRIYNKIVEIEEESGKTWFFDLWGTKDNVWRIEWQVRKDALRRFGIRTFEELFAGQGDVLRYLVSEHDSLRIPTTDSNRSRWPLHPIWVDLMAHIAEFDAQGVYRVIDSEAALNEQLQRIAVSVYGYQKRVAAIIGLQERRNHVSFGDAADDLRRRIERLHDPMSWGVDVAAKREQSRLGQYR